MIKFFDDENYIYVLNTVRKYKQLTPDEIKHLLGEKKYDIVLKSVLPLCFKYAKNFANNPEDFVDLYGEACKAVMEGMLKFKSSPNYANLDFYACCTVWIKDALYTFRNYTCKFIHGYLDTHGIEEKVKKISNELYQRLERIPTLEEILSLYKERYTNPKICNVETIAYCFDVIDSLDNVIFGGDDDSDEDETFEARYNFTKEIPDTNEQKEEVEQQNEIIKRLLGWLKTPQQAEILCKLFGVLGYKQKSRDELCAEYGISKKDLQAKIDYIYRIIREKEGLIKTQYELHKEQQKAYSKNYYHNRKKKNNKVEKDTKE